MNYLPKRYLNQEPKALAEKTFKDRIAVLAIAYHNLAVEQEFLKLVITSIHENSYRMPIQLSHISRQRSLQSFIWVQKIPSP